MFANQFRKYKAMTDKKHMMNCVFNQLAIDYNCEPDDFLKSGLIFTEAKKNEGRRPYPFITPRLEIITMGHSVIINASGDILHFVRNEFEGKTREEIFNSDLIYGLNSYFLPDICNIELMTKPDEFEYVLTEKEDTKKLYKSYAAQYDLNYSENSLNPEVLMISVKHKNEIAGIARAKADSNIMWSIDVDIFNPFRGKGLAAPIVNMLTFEILNRGYIPYYFTDSSNVLSTHVAVRAGYVPAWVHCYKTKTENVMSKNRAKYGYEI